jgi:hypothetical protein
MENSTEINTLQVEPTNKGGAPLGNQNGKKGKLFYDQLRVALVQEDKKRLRNIAEKLVKAAENGDAWAIKEIIDRVDGKAIQATEISGVDGADLANLQTINIVLRKPDGS